MTEVVRAMLLAHGARRATPVLVDVFDVHELRWAKGPDRGELILVDGTRLPVTNAYEICEALSLNVMEES